MKLRMILRFQKILLWAEDEDRVRDSRDKDKLNFA